LRIQVGRQAGQKKKENNNDVAVNKKMFGKEAELTGH
jgi:hypothetical protein